MKISINTQRLAATLSNPNVRDDILIWIDSDENKCCVHPGGSEVYSIACSQNMALHLVEKFRLRGEKMDGGFLYAT